MPLTAGEWLAAVDDFRNWLTRESQRYGVGGLLTHPIC